MRSYPLGAREMESAGLSRHMEEYIAKSADALITEADHELSGHGAM